MLLWDCLIEKERVANKKRKMMTEIAKQEVQWTHLHNSVLTNIVTLVVLFLTKSKKDLKSFSRH